MPTIFLARVLKHSKSALICTYFKTQIRSSSFDRNEPAAFQMRTEQIKIPVPWGSICGQVFGDRLPTARPILCLHGYLDNSNSFKPLAPHLTKTNEFYLIALDFPGHGLSSKLPDGIPYTPKLFVASVRRAVRHLGLTSFYFMSHSYGIGTSIFYQTLFKNEVLGNIFLDWIFNDNADRWKNMDELWKQSIDFFIDEELMDHRSTQKDKDQKELTRDLALSLSCGHQNKTRLLKANPGLDVESAELLLERALVAQEDGKVSFSRDRKVKTSIMGSPDHYGEFVFIAPQIKLVAPTLTIHAVPPSYGEEKGANTMKFIERMRQNSSALIESIHLEGSHHLHMTKPTETAKIIFNFLDKVKSLEPVVAKL